MERYSDNFVTQLPLEERVNLVNNLLIGSSLKKVTQYFEFSKGRLKELLKPYEYNADTKEFELSEVTRKSDNKPYSKSQDDRVIELLMDIRKVLQNSYHQQEISNHFMLQMVDELSLIKEDTQATVDETGLKLFKPLKGDELTTRSFKIYESINDRLKEATKNSDYNQQQIFNSLLDKALREIGC